MHIAMIGSGYLGLVSGACLADFGHNVICVDKDPEKISALQQGECPIFEPGLADLIAGNRRAGRLFLGRPSGSVCYAGFGDVEWRELASRLGFLPPRNRGAIWLLTRST